MKLTKRLTAICLSALLAVGAAAPALAKEAEPSEKEEVIYACLLYTSCWEREGSA